MNEPEVYVLLPQPILDARPLPTSVLPPTRSASVSHSLKVEAQTRRMSLGTLALDSRPQPARARASKRPTTSGGSRPSRQAPGWEGEEVVSLLSKAGLAVTPVKSGAQLGPATIVLVPLCDSPSLPSLAAMLASGQTPSAVCFQNVERTEDEWLPYAIDTMRTVRATQSPFVPHPPIVIAYSANTGLKDSVIAKCRVHGAAAVIKPPYSGLAAQVRDLVARGASEPSVNQPVIPVEPRTFILDPHGPRRRSVDTGRLARAKDDQSKPGEAAVADLLVDMYHQTIAAIDSNHGDVAQLSITPRRRLQLIDVLSSWDFKPHKLGEADLFQCAVIMFDGVLAIEGVHELGIDKAQVERLLFAIRAIYHAPNPYHNYVHAIDVLQATYTFLDAIGVVPSLLYLKDSNLPWRRLEMDASRGTGRARDVLRPQDVLAILIAAMGHDVGHPGLSNAFMKNAKTPLSQVYDDKSVLENMHCMLIVQLLRKHGFGYLIGPGDGETPERHDWRGFRTVLHSAILATDMSLHFAWIQRLREFGTRASDEDGEDTEDRVLVCQAIIKCADISNPTRPIEVSEHWSTVLLQEWAMQASLEQQLSLPISVVASADASLQAKGQVGFIDLFTQPLFDAASDAMPQLAPFASDCADNRAKWQARLESLLSANESAPPNRPPEPHQFEALFPLSLPPSLAPPRARIVYPQRTRRRLSH